mgnify:CR=1 FL=1
MHKMIEIHSSIAFIITINHRLSYFLFSICLSFFLKSLFTKKKKSIDSCIKSMLLQILVLLNSRRM